MSKSDVYIINIREYSEDTKELFQVYKATLRDSNFKPYKHKQVIPPKRLETVKLNIMVFKNGKLISYKDLKDVYPHAYTYIKDQVKDSHYA